MPWQRGRSARDQAKSADWTRIRRAVLERDGYACQIRGPRCTVRASHVDHTDDALGPGDDRPEVLRSACPPCHMGRTARQAHAARPTRARPTEQHPGTLQAP